MTPVKRYCYTRHYLKIVTAFTKTGALIRTVEARGSCRATRIPPVAPLSPPFMGLLSVAVVYHETKTFFPVYLCGV